MEWFSCLTSLYICSCAMPQCSHTICIYILFSTHSTVYNIYTMVKIANMHNNHYYSEVKWTRQQWNGLSGKSFARNSNLSMTTALLKAGLCWFVQVLRCNNVTSHAPWSPIAPCTPYKHSIQYIIHNYTIHIMQNDTIINIHFWHYAQKWKKDYDHAPCSVSIDVEVEAQYQLGNTSL